MMLFFSGIKCFLKVGILLGLIGGFLGGLEVGLNVGFDECFWRLRFLFEIFKDR